MQAPQVKPGDKQTTIRLDEQLWIQESPPEAVKKPEKQIARGCWQCHASQDC